MSRMVSPITASVICLSSALTGHGADAGPQLVQSPGNTTYLVDPANGDDANPAGKPWKTFGKLNSVRLAPGDKVVISPGPQDETLKPSGEGTAAKPVVIQFQPGTHTIGIKNVIRIPIFVSNSMDSKAPKPVGILLRNVKHFRLEGGGVEGAAKTTLLYDGRMVELFNDHAEDISVSQLVFDLKRPTVSEFRVLEAGPKQAVIQVAESSDFAVEAGKFKWKGDWGAGDFCQDSIPAEGRCWRSGTPRGWNAQGQAEATATDLGKRKVRLEYPSDGTGLAQGHQYHFRSTRRDSVGIHTARSKDIVFRDCDVYALTGMGFVSQFTENMTIQRVNVAPPKETIRTCPAWGDIFQFSNCKGDILVDSCRLSGMQDDSLNCHGTYLRIIEKLGENKLLIRYVHGQTYGFDPFTDGDEVAVLNPDKLREYPGNPRRKVTAAERRSDTDWVITLDGPVPTFQKDDVVDNITWHPNITISNNHVSMDPVRGFLLATRGKIVIEGNTLYRCAMSGLLVEGDARGWMESAPIRDMLLQKNRFIQCGIDIGANVKSVAPEEPIHENIRIVDNYFEDTGIGTRGVKGLTITGNSSARGSIGVRIDKSCTDTKVENNNLKKK